MFGCSHHSNHSCLFSMVNLRPIRAQAASWKVIFALAAVRNLRKEGADPRVCPHFIAVLEFAVFI